MSHLGREATRSEIQAARRAARLLEERGQVKLVHVSVPAARNQRGGIFLVATRSQMDLLDWPDESALLRFIATQGPPLIDKTSEALNAIVAALHAAAAKADDVELHAVNDAYADHVVQMMAVSLRKLSRLLGRLVEGQHQPSQQPD